MNVDILPLAITMMAGPGIMASIIFITHQRALPVSLAYVVGVGVSTAVVTAVMLGIVSLVGGGDTLGDSSDAGSAGTIIQVVLVAAAVRNYVRRKTIEPPKWLGTLLAATPMKALQTGLLG